MGAGSWLRRTDWLWSIVGGFYLLGYLFWYVPALVGLPGSLRDPPPRFPWHWPLDFVATGLSAAVLLFLGFRRGTELSAGRSHNGVTVSGGRTNVTRQRRG